MFCGHAETIAAVDANIYSALRVACSTEVRERVIDVSKKAGHMGVATLVEMHNTAFSGVQLEHILQAERQAFLRPKGPDLTAEQHHDTLMTIMRNYAGASGNMDLMDSDDASALGVYMWGTEVEAVAKLWSTYKQYDGWRKEQLSVERTYRRDKRAMTMQAMMDEITLWQEAHKETKFCAATGAQYTSAEEPSSAARARRTISPASWSLPSGS